MMISKHRNRTQELVTIVLDGLHEDLNRVLKKPYVEAVEVQGKRDVYKPSPSPSPFTLTLTLTLAPRDAKADGAPLEPRPPHAAAALRRARSPCEVAEASDIVLASLPSNEASELVALGHDGILEGAAEGDIYVELSTISPTVVHSIAHKTTEKGVHLLDAPVSGGTARASKGRALHHDWRRCRQ